MEKDKKNLQEEILNGDFKSARVLAKKLTFKELSNFMMSRDYDSEKDVVYYFFLLDWLFDEETAELQNIASNVMSFGLTWMPGAYYLGMHHMERAVELEPNDIEYKKAMLTFFEVPERPLSMEKARYYATQIIKAEPKDESTLRALDMIRRMESKNSGKE
jgi:hypothetical protein